MKRAVLARFHSQIGSPVIDAEAGTIRGCRIATLGAVSASAEDEGKGLVMDSVTIEGLVKLAKDKGDRLPAFYTHAWYDSKEDGLNHDSGVWTNNRIENGDWFADFNAFDTPFKSGIFSRAKADPNSIAVSPLFHFTARNGSATLCTPTELLSADFVKRGAINKALFSQTKTTAKMAISIDDLKTLLADSEAKAILQGALDGHTDAQDAAAAEMEAAAGVTDDDKKKEDDTKPAMMRASIRVSRAIARQSAALKSDKETILAEAKVQAGAEATVLLGKGRLPAQTGEPADTTAVAKFAGAVKELTDKGVKPGAANLAVMKSHPDLYNKVQVERGIFKS